MAPNLAASQHAMIHDMLLDGSLKAVQIAAAAGCSDRAIRRIRFNVRCFGTTKAPPNGVGRRRRITPVMLEALRERLIEKPGMYLDEMIVFLWDDFRVLVSPPTVYRALDSIGWSKKTFRQVAGERNADLRDFYLHNFSEFRSYHLVYVDESGCDKRVGFRRTGWSPLGVRPMQITRFYRGNRYQILPAYTQESVLLSRVFQGTTDSNVYEDFIEQLLHHCGRWSEREPNSVLIMDNASIHHSDRIKQMCFDAGAKLVYLSPYSPDHNPIEEFFAELKAFIKKRWHEYEDNPELSFGTYVEWYISVVGGNKQNAEAHFRHAGVSVETFHTKSRSV
jgi:transposase